MTMTEMKNIFPECSINVTYKRGKSLREIFLLNVLMVTKLKTLKFNWLNKCERVIMTLKVSCGVEKSIGKPNFLFYLTEWIVHGTGVVPIEKIEKNSYSLYYIFILCMLLVYIYSCSVWVSHFK